jgi:hypothetical protein
MSALPDIDRRIDAFIVEGPGRAPDDLLSRSLRAATAERQVRRPWWPRRFDGLGGQDVVLLMAGAGAAIIIGGLVIWRGGLLPVPGPTESAVPGATPSASSSPRSTSTPPSPTPRSRATPVAATTSDPVTDAEGSMRVSPGTAAVTFDARGWRVMEVPASALTVAVMAVDDPVLAAIGGVPHRAWQGVWLTRPTAWVKIVEEATIDGVAATPGSAMREAKARAADDPRRKGDVHVQPRVTLTSGPKTGDTLTAGRVMWTTTRTGSDGIDRDVQTTIYIIEAPGPLLRLEAVTLAGGETTPFDVVELVRTVWAPRPLVTCAEPYVWEDDCLPEPVLPASRSRIVP